jgi:hypothetical protein
MASYTVSAGKCGAYAKTLTSETVDTVTFEDDVASVEITTNGTKAVYVTVDGTSPTVAGAGTIELPISGGTVARVIPVRTDGGTVVKLIAAGTPVYSVAAGL